MTYTQGCTEIFYNLYRWINLAMVAHVSLDKTKHIIRQKKNHCFSIKKIA